MGSINTNTAARLVGPYGSRYIFEPQVQPNPGPGEAVVRLEVSGVCHGDVYSRDGGGPSPKQPIRPLTGGHEGVGTIVDMNVESEEQQPKFSIGDVVGIAWRYSACGVCEACLKGCENYCPHQLVNGLHRDGTFQSFITFPILRLVRIPPQLSKESACPFLCAGVTTYTALKRMKPREGDWCAIVGAAGALGHLAVQYAKRVFKLKVIGIDGGGLEKESFCKNLGCDEYVDFVKYGEDLANEVLQRTSGGVHYALMLSPHQEAYNAVGNYMHFQGHVMAIGIGDCHFHLRSIINKDLTITSSNNGTLEDIEDALQQSYLGQIEPCIEVVGLAQLEEALDRVKQGRVTGKIVIQLNKI